MAQQNARISRKLAILSGSQASGVGHEYVAVFSGEHRVFPRHYSRRGVELSRLWSYLKLL